MDPVGIGIVAVGLVALVLIVKWVGRAMRRSFENDAIWHHGRAERGRVVSIRETGRRLGRQGHPSPEVELQLELEGDGSKARRKVTFFVRNEARERVHEGAVLDVRVAPDDDARVVVDPSLRVL